MEPVYLLVRNLLKPWLATWFRYSIEGIENIPKEGPAILAVNHIAYLDPLIIANVVDKAGRRPRLLAKAELFQDKRIAWLLKGAGQIEVKRGSHEAPMALDHALAALRRGEVIVIFPEGTITNDPDLNPMEAKTGMARLALAAGVPVIPVALWGTQNIWPKGYAKRWRPRQDVLIRLGEPISLEGDPTSPVAWKQVGEKVMAAIGVLVAGLRPALADRRRPAKRTAA